MADLLAQTGYNIPTLRRGQEVSGKVVSVNRSEILIDIGAKSEGIVFGRELDSVRSLISKISPGDVIEANVLYPENDAGQIVLSLRKQSDDRTWKEFEEKKLKGGSIKVTVAEINRGGLICEYLGIRGFLPAIQLMKLPSFRQELIGKVVEVSVIEVDRASNRLIFSQTQPEENIKKLTKSFEKAEIGGKYQGEVMAVLPFGIFVEIDLGESKSSAKGGQARVKESKFEKDKLEGLVHISEISWEKVDDPKKYFKTGDKVEVMVISKDRNSGRLGLSVKQLLGDPFEKITSKYSKDQNISGVISKIMPYGVFISLSGGVEGFVNSSKIPPNDLWEVGKSVECTVESVDVKTRRISLIPVAFEKPILYR